MTPIFFLGGSDLEMQTIRSLVVSQLGEAAIRDRALGWGAKLSDYGPDLADLPPDCQPVLVELALDMPLPAGAVVVDHHGPLAGVDMPTSLEQVFRLLGCPDPFWSRHFALVAANDRGHIAALRQMGASRQEILDIRAADRQAQGISAQQEAQAITALNQRRTELGGALVVVSLPHSKTAVITDPLALEDMPPSNVLILSPDEVNFFGSGAGVAALSQAFPGGWSGGELPQRGFWGISAPMPAEQQLLTVLRDCLGAE